MVILIFLYHCVFMTVCQMSVCCQMHEDLLQFVIIIYIKYVPIYSAPRENATARRPYCVQSAENQSKVRHWRSPELAVTTCYMVTGDCWEKEKATARVNHWDVQSSCILSWRGVQYYIFILKTILLYRILFLFLTNIQHS